jgi:hypothetical protein
MAAQNSTSPTPSASGLPISRWMIRASSSARSVCNCAIRRTTAARSATGSADQPAWAAATSSTARRTSSSVAVG